jgi:hypothetical protein
MNSLGYRGEEFDPGAAKRIFVFGCSYTFGTGLNLEDTWAVRFRDACARAWGLAARDVNLLNFAESGASNDCISRTVVTQCEAVVPDVAVVYFTHRTRKEYLIGGEAFMMGPWTAAKHPRDTPETFARESSTAGRAALAEDVHAAAQAYYTFYTDETALLDTLRNILLCQFFCAARGIDLIFTYADTFEGHTPVHAPLVAAIDRTRYIPHPRNRVDTAADGVHGGPQTNLLFAKHLFDAYQSR